MQGYLCVSRPRRFGKTMAANMLAAYYSCDWNSREMFWGLEISRSEEFEKYLNKYDTIFLNMQEFLSNEYGGSVTVSDISERCNRIDMNFEGLKDDSLSILAGEAIPINTGSFVNDMTTLRSEDDVLTLLIQLGYCQSLEEYRGNLILVGVNYDKKTKEHSCIIEEYMKEK